jgi:hypothetical protein
MDDYTVLWILILFVLFFIYFDMRMNKLKKEILQHYRTFEEYYTSTSNNIQDSIPKSYGNFTGKEIENILPTQQEQINFSENWNLNYNDHFVQVLPFDSFHNFGIVS